jgi:hypothetical protein
MARRHRFGRRTAGPQGEAPEASLLRLLILAAGHEDDPASGGLRGARAYGPPRGDETVRYPAGVFVDRRI